MTKREYTWYLEPKDSRTNEIIAKSPGISEEDCRTDTLCADGTKHNLWECPSGMMFMLLRSRSDMKIKFRIWGKSGNGKIYDKTKWLSRESGTGRRKRRTRIR